MLLKNLINNLPQDKKKIKITGLATNSKEVKRGYIFFAVKGNNKNGENFIKEAVSKGAAVIVCANNLKNKHKKKYYFS